MPRDTALEISEEMDRLDEANKTILANRKRVVRALLHPNNQDKQCTGSLFMGQLMCAGGLILMITGGNPNEEDWSDLLAARLDEGASFFWNFLVPWNDDSKLTFQEIGDRLRRRWCL